MPTHLDLFSGIGGFALAAGWAGYETVMFCENDPFCQQVLRKHWPNVPIHDDIRTLGAGTVVTGDIDLLTGGFPCQPFSLAGQRKGQADDRHLWPEMARVIAEVRPRWVLGENTPGLKDMALDDCLHDLEGIGYEAWAVDIPAGAVGAWHRRHRIWILAHLDGGECLQPANEIRSGRDAVDDGSDEVRADASTVLGSAIERSESNGALQVHGDVDCAGQPVIQGRGADAELAGVGTVGGADWWATEPPVGRMVHGIPSRLDRSQNIKRIAALGNAIVPQVAYEIIRLMD